MVEKQRAILFIEDEPDQQKMYAFAFQKAGYNFLQALGGREGVELAKKEKPDLILLDILMDGLDGIATLKLIRKDKAIADIPVVILTNYTKEETLKQAITLGAKEIIVKTDVVPRELVETIEKKYLGK